MASQIGSQQTILDECLELKREIEELQRQEARSDGVLAQLKVQLEEEFGCNNLDLAKKLLAGIEEESLELEKEFSNALEQFKGKWGPMVTSNFASLQTTRRP